jgi:hypothetical protein
MLAQSHTTLLAMTFSCAVASHTAWATVLKMPRWPHAKHVLSLSKGRKGRKGPLSSSDRLCVLASLRELFIRRGAAAGMSICPENRPPSARHFGNAWHLAGPVCTAIVVRLMAQRGLMAE